MNSICLMNFFRTTDTTDTTDTTIWKPGFTDEIEKKLIHFYVVDMNSQISLAPSVPKGRFRFSVPYRRPSQDHRTFNYDYPAERRPGNSFLYHVCAMNDLLLAPGEW